MKQTNIFIFLSLLILLNLSLVSGFSGYSTSYDVSFQIQQFTVNEVTASYNVSSESIYFLGAGNSSNYTHTFIVSSYTADRIPPAINITYPLTNSTINSSSLTVLLNVSFNESVTGDYIINNVSYSLCEDCTESIQNVTLPSFGTNTIIITAEDINGNSNTFSTTFNLVLDTDGDNIPDTLDNDSDGDGINNSEDSIIGNLSNIITNLDNLSMEINESDNLSEYYNTTETIIFKEDNETLVEFEYDFEENPIVLANIKVERYNDSGLGQIIIKGLNLSSGITKTVYVDRIINTSNYSSICIKDADVFDIREISDGCDATDETLIACPKIVGDYECSDYNTSTDKSQWKVTGLTHSAVQQVCTESWTCGDWSSCSSSSQTRTCTDANDCNSTTLKPETIQSCTTTSTDDPGDSPSGGSLPPEDTSDDDTSTNTSDNSTAAVNTTETIVDVEELVENGTTIVDEEVVNDFKFDIKYISIAVIILLLIIGLLIYFKQKKKSGPLETNTETKLKSYIDTCRHKGFSDDKIKKVLIKEGFDETKFEALFK